MSNEECISVLRFSLQHLKNVKLSLGAINAAAIEFNDHCKTKSHLWKQVKTAKINCCEILMQVQKKSGKNERKKNDFSSKYFQFYFIIFSM